MAITREQVEATAETLYRAGEFPTIEKVRFQLGTGSITTINKYLREWKKRVYETRDLQPLGVNPSVPNPVQESAQRLWEQLQAESQQNIADIQKAAEAQIQQAQAAEQLATTNYEQLLQEKEAVETLLRQERFQAGEREQELLQLQQLTRELEAKHQRLSDQLKHQEERYIYLEVSKNQEIGHLRQSKEEQAQQQQQQLQESKEHYMHELSEMKEWAEKERQRRIVELDHLQTENKNLRKELKHVQQECAGLQLTRQHLQAQYEELVRAQEKEGAITQFVDSGLKSVEKKMTEQIDVITEQLKKLVTHAEKIRVLPLQEKAAKRKE